MKHLLISVGMAALLLPLGGMAETHTNQPVTSPAVSITHPLPGKLRPGNTILMTSSRDTDRSGRVDKRPARAQTVVYMQPGDVSVKQLLGTRINGANGRRIAKVRDIVFNGDGQIETLIAAHGGFFGLGAKTGALDSDQVGLTVDARNLPKVRTTGTRAHFQPAPSAQTLPADELLSSDLIGQSADLSQSDQTARIDDLILNRNGRVRYVIASIYPVDPDRVPAMHAVDYKSLVLEQGAGGLQLRLTPAMLAATQKFEYNTAIDSSDQAAAVESQVDIQPAPATQTDIAGSGLDMSQ